MCWKEHGTANLLSKHNFKLIPLRDLTWPPFVAFIKQSQHVTVGK